MESHLSNAMFISEIPVRYMSLTNNDEKRLKWISNLNNRTTAQDVIRLILPTCDPTNYLLYIYTDCKKKILNDSACIYKVIAKINQKNYSRRLLFEICLKKVKKHVRFADEILIQNIIQRKCLSNETIRNNIIETISIPYEKHLEKLKENFQKHIHQQQENYIKLSSDSKRSSLNIINKNIPYSSSESGISSNLSAYDSIVPTKQILETFV
ncbi:unnamed protein product [Rotaria sordida]|uniref:Uncharacterized protein n=1 Tax=Rotaria sordida TaxID=392033 RepID=A0A814F4C8_9BILA|nr:unnamed protein product [Rotaria sordida]CAF1055580.1 unnamed protein product [Rotaria sordida]CAF3589819.1 unnamed protein product [Rotaria sordida]CAF3713488.1 unnamed protein product [Rotaria sordida]